MKRSFSEQGGALMVSLLVILVFTGIVAASNLLSTSQILLSSRSADLDSMQTTAEGLVDYAFAQWRLQMKTSGLVSKVPTTTETNALVAAGKRPSLPAGMLYDTKSPADGNPFTIRALKEDGSISTGSPDKIDTLSENPKGWQGKSLQYVADVWLVSTMGRKPVTVHLQGLFRQDLVLPINGLFYSEGDFELYKPAPMRIGGNVHTNKNAYVTTHATNTTDKLRFLTTSNISSVGDYSHAIPPKAALWSSSNGTTDVQPPIYDRGFANQVSKAEKMEGIGMGTSAEFDLTDTNKNNDGNHELIEPPDPGSVDPPGIASSRIYNNAGLIVEISGMLDSVPVLAATTTSGVYSGSNVKITAKNGTSLNLVQANAIASAISNRQSVTTTVYNPVTKKNETKTTMQQKQVYDFREEKNVLVSDVNVGTLNTTLNALSGFNDILYISNTADVGSNPKAVRLDNGGVLPTDGLTVATPGGLYVMGDYNTGTTTDPLVVPSNTTGSTDVSPQAYKTGYTTKPAALVADAVMFLSNGWTDDYTSKSLSNRTASHTTINSAIIAGYVPSGWVNPSTGEEYWYSGGANNFPRFLENWGGKGMTFNGAFVQLFQSKMFTGEWDTTNIYSPPNRRWSFDPLLLERVIPGIPAASTFTRGQVHPL